MEIKLKKSSKLILYDQIKHVFEKEKYLDDIDSFQMRKSITNFRCSDHKLKIEIGRHKKIPREERISESCRSEVETESHFLSKCPTCNNLREQIFGKELIDQNFEQNILICKVKGWTLKIGNYIHKALRIRESVIDTRNAHKRLLKQLLEEGSIIVV